MADIIIAAILGIIVFFIVRSQLRKLRRGQCSGGCPGCCGSCSACSEVPLKRAKE